VQFTDQPTKLDPASGFPVKVTVEPRTKSDEQVAPVLPQLIPVGLLTTFPLPAPITETVKDGVGLEFTGCEF
jgi:hypothetical protein